MFNNLKAINERPKPFQYYTAAELWTDEHTSKKMLDYHLNEEIDVSSRNARFINRSVSWIIEKFNLNNKSNVLDFGCGPGLYTNRFAERGINVTGVDFSKRSIEYAAQIASSKNLKVNYVHKNYLEYETQDRFDLITMIMCDYCALSPEQRGIMLNKFKELLKHSGNVLLDVYSLKSYNRREEIAAYEFNHLNNFWSPEDYYCFVNTFKYCDEKIILDKYTIIEKAQTRVIYNWLQYYSVETLRREFEDNGLEVLEFYSDVCGLPYDAESLEFAVAARQKN
ncbi:MAG TPA: class I SAM-dependent methyltransferase [Bacillota bacterium]|nr:class I SAM-dependent methyltransferase [Clostridiaceae bacterium]HNR03921.1 class I SAM-dependent methyltransferase [Bacillota bacterium]HNT02790.1 class I SAM-dependent methyltransferase [Bacillota bacterium]HPX67991.1 class I SAM-dependent methyltransferase [Bacillota bacterium]HQA64370.1 class I SAM-dependent methyltransferase [Bacillota bacterium]